MAAGKCDVCDKRTQFGRNIRFQGRGSSWLRKAPKTNREFRPNVQKKRVMLDGTWKRINICTRCLRTQIKHLEAV